MKRITVPVGIVLLAAALWPALALARFEEAISKRPCLNYYKLGDSETCEKPEKKRIATPAPRPPSPTIVAPSQQPPSNTMEAKIDKFIAEHGKPPREFVAFYLDPTPDNAVKWVAKYNEILNRGQEIALAWTQAETLYNQALARGVSASALNPNALPPVPDFGILIPGFTAPPFTQLTSGGLPSPVVPAALDARPAPAPLASPGNAGATPAVLTPAPSQQEVVEVSYYFSAVCPFCKQFEPQLEQALKETTTEVRLLCVDATPEISGAMRKPENLVANLPCQWRAVTAAELTGLGIRQTPSLVINRGKGKPLELISGVVEQARLVNYLNNLKNR